MGHIPRYLTLTMGDAARFWTPDLYVDRVRQINGPNKVVIDELFCYSMNFELRIAFCQVFYFIQPVTLRLYEDSRVGSLL